MAPYHKNDFKIIIRVFLTVTRRHNFDWLCVILLAICPICFRSSMGRHFHPSLIFQSQAGDLKSGAPCLIWVVRPRAYHQQYQGHTGTMRFMLDWKIQNCLLLPYTPSESSIWWCDSLLGLHSALYRKAYLFLLTINTFHNMPNL